jgi:hypothetical protein
MTRMRRKAPTAQQDFLPQRTFLAPIGPPTPIVWSAFTAAEQELLLEDLDVWVTWLAERYRLDHRVVPGCWTQHPELIEELSALQLAWQGAFSMSAVPDAPLNWHERFAVARLRISDWVSRSGCRPDAHRSL